MGVIYSAVNSAEIHIVKNLLEKNGIECFIKNEELFSMARGVPDCMVELWVKHDRDDVKANEIIKVFHQKQPMKETPAWICEKCGEKVEGQFDACWNCGRDK